MKVETRTEALDYLNCLVTDFELLRDGDWIPDDDSCDASLDVLSALIEFVEGLK